MRPLIFGNQIYFHLVLLLEHNNIRKGRIYKVYKNAKNAMQINAISTVIMRYGINYLYSNAILASSGGVRRKILGSITKSY